MCAPRNSQPHTHTRILSPCCLDGGGGGGDGGVWADGGRRRRRRRTLRRSRCNCDGSGGEADAGAAAAGLPRTYASADRAARPPSRRSAGRAREPAAPHCGGGQQQEVTGPVSKRLRAGQWWPGLSQVGWRQVSTPPAAQTGAPNYAQRPQPSEVLRQK